MLKQILISLSLITFSLAFSMHIALDHQKNERLPQAITCYKELLKQNPNDINVLFNLGCCYLSLGEKDNALAAFNKILELDPSQIAAAYNKAFCYKVFGDLDTAISLYKQILHYHPDHESSQLALGFAYITRGNFEQGWQQHQKYLIKSGKNGQELRTLLRNKDVAHKTIVLRHEGDLGDTIHFIRYAQRLKKMGATIIVSCQQSLIPLLSRCMYVDQFLIAGTELPEHDAHATLMSLPAIFEDNEETAPTSIPYVHADPERIEYWQKKLAKDANFKIGICWQASVKNDANKLLIGRRGYPLLSFANTLSTLKNVSFYSLQKYDGVEQIENLPADFQLNVFENLDEESGAFMDTAALIKSLHLVITVDTAVAHLAGALGCEVWLLHPYATADWRWISGRENSYWYPKMRIFKQKEAFGYDEVMKEVREELERKGLLKPLSFLII